jgi:hypothetical protein
LREIQTEKDGKPEVWVFQPDQGDIITDATAGDDPFEGERIKAFLAVATHGLSTHYPRMERTCVAIRYWL